LLFAGPHELITSEEHLMLKEHHIDLFGCHHSKWEKTTRKPLTIEEIITMTLCRFVARLRNMPMEQVDEEESTIPFPLLDIQIHTECDQDNEFGSQQTIIKDLRSCPLNAIMPLSEPEPDKLPPTEFEFSVNYCIPPELQLKTGATLYALQAPLVQRYTELRSLERMGMDIKKDLLAFQKEVGWQPGEILEKYLYQPLANQGLIKSCLNLDLEAIGALKRYIAWVHWKKSSKETKPLLEFTDSHLKQDVHRCISQIESGLTHARKRRYLTLQENAKKECYWDDSNHLQLLMHPSNPPELVD